MPQWISEGNNSDLINTGNEVADQVITVLLSTSMFVAGVLGFVLDNTIPGIGALKCDITYHVAIILKF